MGWQDVLVPGAVLTDVPNLGRVTVVSARPVGNQCFLTYRDEYGMTGSRMLTADHLTEVRSEDGDPLDLRADPDAFWLAAEALRLRHAADLNPLLALTSANVEPLPHQVQAVYDHLLTSHPQRFLLADDPGAGKTVMAGLYIKELLARGLVRRCLIVVPGSLTEQWQDELAEKFGLRFEIFDSQLHASVPGNPFADLPLLIVRIDQFARNHQLRERLAEATYDLAVVDEAHKLTARDWGSKVVKSKRFELGEQLRDQCPSLLLMTATPHNGKEGDFQHFLSLLREGAGQTRVASADTSLMRRLVKEQLVHADGTPLFPERRASTVAYRLSGVEHDLYEDVTEYVRHEMNKVTGEETRRTVGFALLVLQRRLASSPEAILRSLERRRDRLQAEAARMRTADDRLAEALQASLTLQTPEQREEWSAVEAERWEDDASSVATAARTVEELEVEVAVLDQLVDKARRVREADVDAKWEALAELLQSREMYDAEGRRRKIIIFTEHKDTLEYLEDRLLTLLGSAIGIEVIHGGTSRPDRRLAQIRFTQEQASAVLLATDAAGEGVNLQVAHLMVNYDIPWNPNRLEQRFGRIHRIGQRHTCHLWNLVTADTREGEVFTTLLGKLEIQREALGDRVFDVLGDVLTGANLTQLLSEAVRSGSAAQAEVAGEQLEADLQEAVAERTRSVSTLTPAELVALRHQMQRAAASSLQPRVAQDFTTRAMARLHGELAPTGELWTARHVPARVREHDPGTVRPRYDALTFEPLPAATLRAEPLELISPGHPLLDALVAVILQDHAGAPLRGTVLADDRSDRDYVLLSAIVHDPQPRLVTLQVCGDDVRRADPAGFADLLPSSAQPTQAEVRQARDTADRAPSLVLKSDAPGRIGVAVDRCEPICVAYVRGVASPDDAAAWHDARRIAFDRSRLEGVVREAPLFAGYDFEVATEDALRFVHAAPRGGVPLRRSEAQARDNVGQAWSLFRAH